MPWPSSYNIFSIDIGNAVLRERVTDTNKYVGKFAEREVECVRALSTSSGFKHTFSMNLPTLEKSAFPISLTPLAAKGRDLEEHFSAPIAATTREPNIDTNKVGSRC